MQPIEYELSKKDQIIKLRIYRILVGFFVGISLSCSHQTLHWLLSLISEGNDSNTIQSVVYYFLEAFFFFTVAPFAIMSDNVLIISTCLLVQFLFYITVTAGLSFFKQSTILQYLMTFLFALSRSILFGRLLVMMKNWFSQRKLVLCVGLTYFLNELFSIFSTYWDASEIETNIDNTKDRIQFICLLLSSVLGLIIQGKPSIMGLNPHMSQSVQDQEEEEEEKRDKFPGEKQGIISNFVGLDESYVQKVFGDDEHDAMGNRKVSIFKQILQIKKIIFFIISSICLKLLDWYTNNQIYGVLLSYQQQEDFSSYLLNFCMYGIGGLLGVISLGLILDVYNQEFTLRMAICSLIGLSASYTFSVLFHLKILPQIPFMILSGFFEFSFYCTYQVGVPIVLVFDLMRFGDFSFLIIPLFSGLDRLVNALYNVLNQDPQKWTTSSTIIQPICIVAMFISLLVQYLKDRQRSTKFANGEPEDDDDDQASMSRPLSVFNDDDKDEAGLSKSYNQNSHSRHGTQNNFKISITNDDLDEPIKELHENMMKYSLEQDTKFVLDKKSEKNINKFTSDFD